MDRYFFIEDSTINFSKHVWYRMSSTFNKYIDSRLVAHHDRVSDKMHRSLYG